MNVFAFTDLPISNTKIYDKIYHNNIFWLNFDKSKSKFTNVNKINFFKSNDSDVKNIMNIYDKILGLVAENLNLFYKHSKSLKYYRIFFGSTLYVLATSFYYSNKNLKYLNSFFLKESEVKLIFYKIDFKEILNQNDLTSFFSSRKGLQYIYQFIILNDKNYDFLKNRIIWDKIQNNGVGKSHYKNVIKQYIKKVFFSILNISFTKKEIIFFSANENYFKIFIKNLFSNVYYFNFFEREINFNYDSLLKLKSLDKTFPKNLINFLNYFFPKQYLLKEEELTKISKKYKLPTKIKNIFTTDMFQGILINSYIAEQVFRGAKLYCIQHGGAYKVHKFFTHEFHERKVSDFFISAGNADSKNYNFESKMFNFNLYRKIYNYSVDSDYSKNNLITVQLLDNYYSEYLPASDLTPKFMKSYFHTIDELFTKSEHDNFKKINFKLQLYPKISTYDYYNYYNNKYKNLKFWPLGISQKKVYNNSKVIILTYFSTAILELAYHNKAFVLILDSRINYSSSVSKTIEDFLKLGIVHYEIDSLLNFLNKTNINDWFYSIKIQKAINEFKMNYVWISNDKKFDIKNFF